MHFFAYGVLLINHVLNKWLKHCAEDSNALLYMTDHAVFGLTLLFMINILLKGLMGGKLKSMLGKMSSCASLVVVSV